ncbi:hypothetical protein PCC9214_00260 [Planktothrix tepida]|uniref:Uncharacterized protein n=2 Tax=Planktothrix TaxID=54304 RepID=A0A1J1LEZ3_9CYAN|nr:MULTISPECIES: hypothetical protein [Planktothrix]CAD5914583.1 hypothetical protein PCC9214_00260 [Planktothrix tepida]CAD5986138.1 hypothetical protein NO713_05555 [Planktothrix pseudagardhii]CUR30562.1 conserved membrane hypothetical protein [Planktothrix tepida PCC 9214]
MDTETYEFNESQNQLILDLSKKMLFVSYFLIASGILGAISGIIAIMQGGFGGIVQGVVLLVTGIWTINASKAFKLIVETQGNDIENLIGALGQLRKLYTLQYWLFMIALIFIVIGFIAAIILAVSGGIG